VGDRQRELVDAFSSVRAFVAGDAMIDRYTFGRVSRICPEAPVPILVPEHREVRPGGAANVSHQLNTLGATVSVCFGECSVKHRFMVGQQLLLRLDEDQSRAPDAKEIALARQSFREFNASVLVLSDYAKGWLSADLCIALIGEAVPRGIPVVVDPKGDRWGRYSGATVITPNEHEMKYVKDLEGVAIVEKQGSRGMLVHVNGRLSVSVPSSARHVYDVTGAGDTVTALLAATLGAGGTVLEGAQLASLAAGYVVGEVGTTVCPKAELLRHVHATHH